MTTSNTQLIAVSQLRLSKLNPRDQADPEELQDLAAGISARGVLQNLVVRPHPKERGAYEVAAGSRRLQAVWFLAERKDPNTPDQLACSVQAMTDLEFLAIATQENILRAALSPMEEARAFQNMIDTAHAQGLDKYDTGDVSKATGVSSRVVQLRLKLVRDLIEPAQEALEKGDINLAQARALSSAPAALQTEALPAAIDQEQGFTTGDDLRRNMLEKLPEVRRAIFPVEQYKGALQEFPDGTPRFEDVAQFRTLQEAAIKALQADLKAKFGWCKLVRLEGSYWGEEYQWQTSKDKDAGALVIVSGDLTVRTLEGYKKRTNQNHVPGTRAAKPKTVSSSPDAQEATLPWTQDHLVHARTRRGHALQAALAISPKAAMVAVIYQLWGSMTVRRQKVLDLGRAQHAGPNHGELKLGEEDPAVAHILRDFAQLLELRHNSEIEGVEPRATGGLKLDESQLGAELWDRLMALKDRQVEALFCAVVATRAAAFNPEYLPSEGDNAGVIAMAASLGLRGKEQDHGLQVKPEDLAGLKRPALEQLAIIRGVAFKPTTRVKELSGAVGEALGDPKHKAPYTLPTFRFEPPKTVQEAGRDMGVAREAAANQAAERSGAGPEEKLEKATAPADEKPAAKRPRKATTADVKDAKAAAEKKTRKAARASQQDPKAKANREAAAAAAKKQARPEAKKTQAAAGRKKPASRPAKKAATPAAPSK